MGRIYYGIFFVFDLLQQNSPDFLINIWTENFIPKGVI